MCTFAKINRPRGQQNPCASGNVDHVRDADARTARNTAVNWAASSMPDATRTTAPASLTEGPQARGSRGVALAWSADCCHTLRLRRQQGDCLWRVLGYNLRLYPV